MKRYFFAVFILFMIIFPASAAINDIDGVIYDTASVSRWDAYFSGKPFGELSSSEAWQLLDGPIRAAGVGSIDSEVSLRRRLQTFETKYLDVRLGILQIFENLILDIDAIRPAIDFDSSLGVYRFVDERSGIWIVSTDGSFPYYDPTSDDGTTDSNLGGQWIRVDKVNWNRVNILSEYSLYDIGYALRDAGNDNDMETRYENGKPSYLYIQSTEMYENGIPFVYCDKDGNPYVNRPDPDEWAQEDDNNYYTDDDDDNIFDDGEPEDKQLIDIDDNVLWFPNGTLQYINNLIYDASNKTYYVDAHQEYDLTTNTYITNNYYYEYHINHTSVTYIGQTEEYDEKYEFYFELPDGRNSADLTAEELQALNTQIDVLPYVRSADDTSIRALYHFDGNTRDSSYWSHLGNMKWNKGSSITYMDVGAFNGALYLDENEHDFTITLPSGLGTGDFTIQWRYYQSHTIAPQLDSTVSLGGMPLLRFDGASIFLADGTELSAVSIGNWQEIALVRKRGVIHIFLNGVGIGSVTEKGSFSKELNFHFGSAQQTYKYFDELRVINQALYDTDGYTPTSVPYDTNLALVLPDSQIPVADEYWTVTSSGKNLLSQYGMDWWTDLNTIGNPYFLVDEDYPSVNSGNSQYWTSLLSTRHGLEDMGFPVFGIMPGINPFVVDEGFAFTSVPFEHKGKTLPLFTARYSSAGYFPSYGLMSILGTSDDGFALDPDNYVFSILVDSGDIITLPFTMYDSFDLFEDVYVDGDGYRVGLYKSRISSTNQRVTLAIQPLAYDTPVPKIVYMELVEGTESDLSAEFISSVVAMDKDDLTTPSLAVRTDLTITGYQIGGVRPSLPEKGLVWALVESGRINSLQIYNGQAWEEVDGRIWTGSRWVPYYAYDVLLLKDMWDIVGVDPTLDPIYTETGFWTWLQKAWGDMMGKLDQIIAALGGPKDPISDCSHVYTSEIGREPTCTEPGHMTYTCDLCGHAYTELIDATGHDWVVTDLVDGSSTDYVFVDSLDECTDTSKKYVLSDGYVYEWHEGSSMLPGGYQQVEYIESTGTQYINSNFAPSPNSRIVMDFAATRVGVVNNFFGSRVTTSSRNFCFLIGEANKFAFGYDDTYYLGSDGDTDRHFVDFNSSSFYFDGELLSVAPDAVFTGVYPLFVGAIKASAKTYYSYAEYYSCQIYDDTSLVRDLIPCISSSGEVGMYDVVYGVFYGNSGTGSFVAGPEVEMDVSRWIPIGKYDELTCTYKELTCSKCGAISRDYGDGPEEVDLFDALGDFIAEGITWILDKLTELADSLKGITDTFNSFVEKVKNLAGGYPAFFGAVMALIPEELSAILWFAVIGFIVLAVWKKWSN